ncbi:MAG TPA: HAMP domain-containing sensor histidine kinase [Acidimicrobiia bacterium]|nr:HAMP domain-containing sensor histidine kinase [Acidimicrobiia bacterium]
MTETPAPARGFGRGLRFRVTFAFALSGLLVATVIAAVTDTFASRYVVRQREDTATQQAYLDARLVRDELAGSDRTPSDALGALELPSGTDVVLFHEGQWFASGLATSEESLPIELRERVLAGEPLHQRFRTRGEPVIATGIPIPSVDARFFEIVSLEELERTLGIIRATLLGAAITTTLGAALLGLWVGRRVLRPVGEVSRAAVSIAEGDLDTRLDPGSDPDLAQLANAFNAMVDALQARIERDARFAADVSHELRSPITTLAASAEMMQSRRADLPERSQMALDLLVEEVRRFQDVVEELLELGRIDAGVEPLEPEPVVLGELLLQAVTRRHGELSSSIELGMDVSTAPLLVDKRRLQRVLANLFENAESHGGGVVAVTARREDGRAYIVVDDAGPGIPDADRTKVFERFYRGSASGRRGSASGSGLGLALVAEHLAAMGGSVAITDRPGGGARVVVEIPWRAP